MGAVVDPPVAAVARVVAAAREYRTNMVWEFTQAIIAIVVVLATVLAAFLLPKVPDSLTAITYIIVGFYFGRTNHNRPVAVPAQRRTDPA